jgi:hypothetical protein
VPARLTPRIVPPHPITVAIEKEGAIPVAYGVIADISENGACVWTDVRLSVHARLQFRISFARPAEVYEVSGLVVWSQDSLPGTGCDARRYGIEWQGATPACRSRLQELAGRAVPPPGPGEYPFQAPWTVEAEEA